LSAEPQQLITLAIFAATYGAIILRNLKGFTIPIWAILLAGAVAMVFVGSIGVVDAYQAVNLPVIAFLFSMFALVTALDISGALESFANALLRRAKKPADVIYLTFFGFAFGSAFLMNDTLALMGTPIMLTLSRRLNVSPRPLLLTLAFAVTTGSVVTPMGNPQNLLIALASGITAPVIGFASYLLVPTLLNLAATCLLLRVLFRKEFHKPGDKFEKVTQLDEGRRAGNRRLARLSILLVVFTLALILAVNLLEAVGIKQPFGISEVSLLGAALLLLLSGKGREILRAMDWGILLLFAGLFVLMQSLSNNGIISSVAQYLPALGKGDPHASIFSILVSGLLLSQVLSNVPMVALYLPIMKSLSYGPQDVYAWAALAGGSTLAGNLTILGAASNLIIIEEAERRGVKLSFIEFLKVGVLVTAMNFAILYASLYFGV
jgi:Na+/H+ antiporter NhaD/arsenite permease-like protein